MRKDISLLIRNYVGDIKYLNASQQFADTNDGSSELEMEMRKYAPKFLKSVLEDSKWELHLDTTGEVINGFGYTNALRDKLVEHLPNFTMYKFEDEN